MRDQPIGGNLGHEVIRMAVRLAGAAKPQGVGQGLLQFVAAGRAEFVITGHGRTVAGDCERSKNVGGRL